MSLLSTLVLLNACAAGSNSHTTANSSGAPAQHPLPGAPAIMLARQLPGCIPAPLTAADSNAPGLATHPSVLALAASDAACTLRGRTAVIITFTRAGDQRRANSELARVDAYYATGATGGTRWSAAPEQVAAVSGQQSIVQDVALALRGLVQPGRAS